MNIKCEVIRDLLPLYIDGIASKESQRIVDEHLENCEECRKYMALLQEELSEDEESAFADETAPLRRIKRRISFNRILIVLITLGFAIAAGAVFFNLGLAEYEGSLEENLSYKTPTGYEEIESKTDTGNIPEENYKLFVRKMEDKNEYIKLFYNGLDDNEWIDEDKVIQLNDSTKVIISCCNFDNSRNNTLSCKIQHGDETYHLEYSCHETNRENYYSSCSETQEQEIVGFIKTFDFHRPSNSEGGSIIERLHHNLGTGGVIVLILTMLIFVGIPIMIAVLGIPARSESNKNIEPPVTSKDLHEAMNRERKSKGETNLPSINTVQGVSSNTLARRDHSWNSVPDFFIKMFSRK